jgi:hypothetical protein
MKRFRLSVESLESRETPAGLASVTDLVVDSYNPAPSDSYYGTGVYKSMDGGQTWANSGEATGRVTGIVVDPTDPAAARGGVIHVYVHVITNSSGTGASGNAAPGSVWYPGTLTDFFNGGSVATKTGNVYTVTFSGSLVG